MILRNKRTRKFIQLSYVEFQTKFSNEIQAALKSYTQTENNKPYFRTKINSDSDFYFNLQWNFNHYSNAAWYIERL